MPVNQSDHILLNHYSIEKFSTICCHWQNYKHFVLCFRTWTTPTHMELLGVYSLLLSSPSIMDWYWTCSYLVWCVPLRWLVLLKCPMLSCSSRMLILKQPIQLDCTLDMWTEFIYISGVTYLIIFKIFKIFFCQKQQGLELRYKVCSIL